MPDRNAPSQNSTSDNLSAGVDRLTERAGQLNERVSDIARAAAEKVDENREAAGRRLETVSTSLHERADNLPGGEKVSGFAHATADTIRSTSDYVREHDVDRMMTDAGTLVKNNPGPALLAAAFVGFLAGRALSSR